MNTILLQKILDILTEGLAHVGDFFKDLFVTDPQDGQIIAYDAETGHWVNKDATEVELDLTNTFEAQAIATLTDGAENVPMKSLVVDIVPKQASGTPTPENPLPISGTDEVVITHTGKNLFDKTATQSANQRINTTYGTTYAASGYNTTPYIRIANGKDYTLTTGIQSYFAVYDKDKTFLAGGAWNTGTSKTSHANAYYIRFDYSADNIDNIQLEAGTTATPYEPYTATTHTIALPSTVYGGEVDVVSGSGTENYSNVDLGSLTWNETGTPNIFYATVSGMKAGYTPICYCSIYEGYSGYFTGMSNNQVAKNSTYRYIYIKDTRFSTVADIGDNLDGIMLYYPVDTPTPITTTPTTIKTHGGTESIFADCGNVSGEYYTKTAESVIALANITEDITSSITKNTTDFSDILLKVSQNNKAVSVEIYSATTAAAVNDTFLSNLPKPAMNCKVLLVNTTLGEDGTILGTLKTTGELEIATSGAKSFSGLITYVAK